MSSGADTSILATIWQVVTRHTVAAAVTDSKIIAEREPHATSRECRWPAKKSLGGHFHKGAPFDAVDSFDIASREQKCILLHTLLVSLDGKPTQAGHSDGLPVFS